MSGNMLRTWIKKLSDALQGNGSRRQRSRAANRREASKIRPAVEALEDRLVPNAYVVNTLANSGNTNTLTGSLPYCVAQADANAGSTITFSVTGTITLSSTLTVSANTTITGPGAQYLAVSGGNSVQDFFIGFGGVTASISGLTIEYGNGVNSGGGVANHGNLTLSQDIISGNNSSSTGGGIYNGGTLSLSYSTVANNSSDYGGGLANSYDVSATINDCTFSGNTGRSGLGGSGAGICDYKGGPVSLSNSTVANNNGAGAWVTSMDNSIVADNTGQNAYSSGVQSGTNCLIGYNEDVSTTLAYNGGATETLALLPGSPALGAGDPVQAGTTAENGVVRPAAPDIGAYQTPPPTVASVSPDYGLTTGGTSVIITGSGFTGATAVSFGSTAATTFTVNSATQITATDAAATGPGTVDATVATSVGGTSATSTADQFAFVSTPTVTSSTANIADSASTITINGSNFSTNIANDAVAFNLGVAGTVTTATASQLVVTLTAPPTSLAQLQASVTTYGSLSSSSVAVATETNSHWLVTDSNGTLGGGSLTDITLPYALAHTLGGDEITFASSLAGGSTINLSHTLTVDTSNVPIIGPGAAYLAVSGGNSVEDFFVGFGVTASISGLTIEYGNGVNSGGGVANHGNLTLSQDIISGNNSSSTGGGIYNGGTLSLSYSTVANNSSDYGGGLANSYDVSATINDCTFSGNTGRSGLGGSGAGICDYKGGPVSLSNSTVANNNGAGAWVTSMDNSIVADNTGQNAYSSGVQSGTNCLIGYNEDVSTTLAYNGGATETLALLPGSPALGAGDPVQAGTTAENGVVRPAAPDIGAYQTPVVVAAPTVSGLSPASGPVGGGTSVIITGTGFTGATAVDFGSTAATTYTVNSATQITATDPAEATGTADVTVTVPGGGTSAISSADQFTYTGLAVTAVSPRTGGISGGTTVTITGTGFSGTATVDFGSTAATTFSVNGPGTQITAVDAAGSGEVDITVVIGTHGSATSPTSSADEFTYVSAPAVTGLNPTEGTTTGGTVVVITGTAFTGASAVKFGSTAATTYTINSATQITATDPAGTSEVDVTVTTAGGTSSSTSADYFTYVAAPTVSGISPASGPTAGNTTVTITGAGFSGATAVKFGNTAASTFTVNSATQITAVDAAGTSLVDVTVAVPGGGTSGTVTADEFNYVAIATPTVTGLSPASGLGGGGTSVVITGTGFSTATAVKFGSTAATSFTINSSTQITATDAAGSSVVDVTVASSGGTSSTSTTDHFTYATVSSVNVNGDVAPIVDMSSNGVSTVTVTTNGNSGFTAGDTVVISGYTGTAAGYNGTFTIGASSGNTFTVTNATASLPALSSNTQGLAVSQNTASGLTGSQRSMVDSVAYTFSAPVTGLTTANFTLTAATGIGLTTSGSATAATTVPGLTLTSLDGGSIWVATWNVTNVGHSIADGVYDLTLANSGRAADTFYRLYGNVVGYSSSEARVISADTLQFSHSYLQSSGEVSFVAGCDYNADGQVNSTDTLQVAHRYLSTWSGFTPTI